MLVWNPLACTSAPAGTLEHCDEVIVNETGALLGRAAALRAAWAESAAAPNSSKATRVATDRPVFMFTSTGQCEMHRRGAVSCPNRHCSGGAANPCVRYVSGKVVRATFESIPRIDASANA
jgi:hypothetical protein